MKNTISHSGFTLIETLVAVSIIMIAITGPYMSAERTITVASILRNKMTAVFLAQEGVEYVRVLRDKVYLEECYQGSSCGSWWSDFSSNPFNNTKYNIQQCSANGCSIDMSPSKSTYSIAGDTPFSLSNNKELFICSSGAVCGNLYLNKTTGQYTTTEGGGAVPTTFVRTISARLFTSSNDMKVTSTVTWKYHGNTYSTSVSGHLTSWY